jgi:acyl-CoA ligase (AMP-forming) (exosortase A-associated)
LSPVPSSVHDLLTRNLDGGEGRVAIVEPASSITYGELDRRAAALAAWLEARGVGRGDRVVIHLQKSIEEVVATFASARLGAIFVNVHPARTLEQLLYAVADSGARVVCVDARRASEMARRGLPDAIEHVLVRGNRAPQSPRFAAWNSLPEGGVAPIARVDDDEPAAILYTSGSTGKPKGVVLSHGNVLEGARSVASYLGNHRDDKLLSVLPFSFDYGLNQLTTMCLVGGSLVLGVAMASEIAKAVVTHRCTGLAAVPPLWIPIVRHLEATGARMPSLRYVTNSGGAIPSGVLRSMPEVLGRAEIFLMYGLTEAFRSTYLPPALFFDKMGSIGKAIPGAEVFVINERGVAGPGEEGELVHRGPLVSLGYWGKPEATADKIKPCRALRELIGDEKVCFSGDRVRVDEDGFLWFVSRADAMIKCSGHRISPTEVEDVVYESKIVGDCVAFGVKDEELGEVVHVAVAGLEGAAERIGEAQIIDFCRRNLPSFMVPARVHVFARPLPRNANGKLDRPAIVLEATR